MLVVSDRQHPGVVMTAVSNTRAPAGQPSQGSRQPKPSQVTLKVVMAVTGIIFSAFVLVHMVGNLKIYMGGEHFDGYAHWLRRAFEPLLPHEGLLWIFRVTLLVCLIAHLWSSFELRRRGRIARGKSRRRPTGPTGRSAASMPWTGLFLLAFIVFHLLDLTIGTQPAAPDGFAAGSAKANVVASFSRVWAGVIYLVTMIALCAHMAHGLVSCLLDLGGWPSKKGWQVAKIVALAFGLLVAFGNATIPVAIWTGVVK